METYWCPTCGTYFDPGSLEEDENDGPLTAPLELHDDDCDEAYCSLVHDGTSQRFYVGAWECHESYGGPEEGGWWFTNGWPIASVPVKAVASWRCGKLRFTPTDEDVILARDVLRRAGIATDRAGARPDGRHTWHLIRVTHTTPQPFPKRLPRYE